MKNPGSGGPSKISSRDQSVQHHCGGLLRLKAKMEPERKEVELQFILNGALATIGHRSDPYEPDQQQHGPS